MKTLRKMDLDEMARTMQVIPEEGLMYYTGGSYQEFNSLYALYDYLSSMMSGIYIEQAIYMFSDGSYGVYVDESFNTANKSRILYDISPSHPGNIYYNGKQVKGVAHTHQYGPSPSDYGDYGGDINNKVPGIPNYVFYGYVFYEY